MNTSLNVNLVYLNTEVNSEPTYTIPVPIKIVASKCFLSNQIITGTGATSTILGVPYIYIRTKRRKGYQYWYILLDSGSDGDLYFRYSTSTDHVPYTKRLNPLIWKTSSGTFVTQKVGNIKMLFPDFNDTKYVTLTPDIINVPADATKPTYDMIIGVQNMLILKIVMDFGNRYIIMDGASLPMNSIKDFQHRAEVHKSMLSEFL